MENTSINKAKSINSKHNIIGHSYSQSFTDQCSLKTHANQINIT